VTALPRVDSSRAALPDIHRLRAALAALLAFALIAAASIVGALPARAIGGAVVANVTAASTDGLAVQASASGLDGVAGAYVALIPRGGEGAVTGTSGVAAQEWVRAVVDGQLSVTLTAPAAALDRATDYEVIVWQQHSAPSAENIYARGDLVIGDAQWNAVFPPVEPEPEPEPEPELPTPTVTVSKTTGIDPEGETVTVTGTGFVAAPPATTGARPPLAGKFTGTYIAFGSFLEAWQPSSGAPASARKALDTKWGVLAADMAIIGGAKAGAIELAEDGSFSTTLTLTRDDAAALEGGRWGVYTYPGGGAKHAPFETYTPIAFAEPVPAGPTVTVSKTTGIDPEGETVTVTGTGFVAAPPATTGARPPLAGKFTGTYIAFGSFLEAWQPSSGAPASARKALDTKWGVLAADMAIIGGAKAGAIELAEDGSFSTTLTLTRDDAAALEGGRWGVYTYPGGGAKHAPFETYTPIAFAEATTPEPTPEPTPPTTPPTGSLDAGSLRWGISAPFAAYITGPIAQGAISVSQGATRAGGVFQFGQAAGSTFDPATGLGAVAFTGAVRYTGHGGLLDVSLANPTLQISAPGSAALTVSHGGARVHVANVALSAGTTTRSGDTVTIAGAPTTLTASGVGIFQNNYPAGTALEPLTVTIGAPAAAPAGATGTVASAPAPAALRAIPAAPPATTGIELDDATRAALEAGEQVTLRAAGFGAGERDIFAVVYSTPTVLDRELVADADGVVSWTGALPATLANGEHTFTFQGSVARGIPFTLERAAAAAIGSCAVTEASLSWGFMTTFRNYIEGIGGGGWELEGVEYRYPHYVWPTGTGAIDAAKGAGLVDFGGAIRFTGHDGALDTTLANTRIELAGETGYLVIDVSGTTQSGSAVDAAAVRFATFAVPEGAWDAETGVLTLSDVPTSLTADGAAAFGSYPEGTALDPLSATIAVDADCLAPREETVDIAVAASETPEAAAEAGAPVWPWVAGGIALLVIVAGAWVFAVRRRAGAVRE